MMDLSLVPYESRSEPAVSSPGGDRNHYRECMRNHAASIGGHAFDGCGEFMPSCADPLKCAACECHRSFHRRGDGGMISGGDLRRPLLLPPPPAGYFPPPFVRVPLAAMADRSRSGSETPPRTAAAAMDGGGDGSRKRNRTKFTAEQKEKMQAFAERLGWRIQKHDDVALEEFCVEIGVKRHVLKVWMHNNKNHLSSSSTSAAAGQSDGKSSTAAAAAAAISV